MQGGAEANAARALSRSAEEGQGVGRDTELLRKVMVDGGVDIKAHLIRMFDLALDLPVELRMRLLGRTLHLRINTKTHFVPSLKSGLRVPNSLSLHLTAETPNARHQPPERSGGRPACRG